MYRKVIAMRTNIDIDDKILEEAMKISHAATKKDTIHLALIELIRREKMKKLSKLYGSKLWEGNLSRMRTQSK
ncbi:MAG: type II toxin-antitoxin system VapB family antitoxin [Saprospiraceae bacterium]